MAIKPAFGYSEAVQAGWELTKSKWRMILVYGAVVFSLQIVSYIFSGNPNEPRSAFSGLVSLVIAISVYCISFAWNRLGIYLVDGKPVEIKDLFWFNFRSLLNFFVASLMYGVIVLVGFLLLIVPGIIFALMFSQYTFLIAEKGLGPIEALKESRRLTSGQKGRLFIWGFVEFLVLLGGLLLLFVGLVIAIPVIMMAQFYIYTKLRDAAAQTS